MIVATSHVTRVSHNITSLLSHIMCYTSHTVGHGRFTTRSSSFRTLYPNTLSRASTNPSPVSSMAGVSSVCINPAMISMHSTMNASWRACLTSRCSCSAYHPIKESCYLMWRASPTFTKLINNFHCLLVPRTMRLSTWMPIPWWAAAWYLLLMEERRQGEEEEHTMVHLGMGMGLVQLLFYHIIILSSTIHPTTHSPRSIRQGQWCHILQPLKVITSRVALVLWDSLLFHHLILLDTMIIILLLLV